MGQTFKGHKVSAIIVNIIYAVLPLVLLKFIEYIFVQGIFFLVWVCIPLFILIFPHPTYLFFEAKHLTGYGGSISYPTPVAIIVFGLLSLSGLGLQVWTNLYLLHLLGSQTHILFFVTIISFLATLGACLGLTDLRLRQGYWPPAVLEHLKIVMKSKKMLVLLLATTILLTLLTLLLI